MARYVAAAVMPFLIAACAPSGSESNSDAVSACNRPDVQDVVGKEARSLMLKGNSDRLLMAGLFGLDVNAILKAWEDARVSFSSAGAFPSSKGPPFSQIVCGSAVQFDLSDAMSGQQIVSLPRLRWTINFVQPTDDPSTGTFTIEIDPVSLIDGRALNGKQMLASPPQDEPGNGGADVVGPDAQGSTSGPDDAAAAAKAAEDDFNAAAQGADTTPDFVPQPKQGSRPSDADLYAPHSN